MAGVAPEIPRLPRAYRNDGLASNMGYWMSETITVTTTDTSKPRVHCAYCGRGNKATLEACAGCGAPLVTRDDYAAHELPMAILRSKSIPPLPPLDDSPWRMSYGEEAKNIWLAPWWRDPIIGFLVGLLIVALLYWVGVRF